MKKVLSVLLFFVLVVTSFPLETSAAGLHFANCQLKCFTSGTPVQTAEGLKPIEKIKVGDLVLTKDETSGKIEYNPVVKLYQRETSDTYSITAKGITVTATGDHPFWVHNKGWVDAQHLKVGDRLQNADGALYSIDRIEYKNGKAEVFNFQVQNVHNYFVTELGLWVHNCGGGALMPSSTSVAGTTSRIATSVSSAKTYQTYTKTHPTTGQVYSGRTSGTGTPAENIAKRDAGHHMNAQGYGKAKLDQSSSNPDAIRGREQQLIDKHGGAQSQGGTSGNKYNSISNKNKNKATYMEAANNEFGVLPW